jgi:hypothetical protein
MEENQRWSKAAYVNSHRVHVILVGERRGVCAREKKVRKAVEKMKAGERGERKGEFMHRANLIRRS